MAGDLLDPDAVKAAASGVSVVFHAASVVPGAGDADQMQCTNITGTRNIVDACLIGKVRRLVYVSSVSVYRPPLANVINEDAPVGGVDLYGQSKCRAEDIIRELAGRSAEYVILRLSQVYGAGDRSGFTRSLLRLCELPLLPVCRGYPARLSLLHVDDAIEAILASGTADDVDGKTFNIAGIKRISLDEMASYCAKKSGMRQHRIPTLPIILRVALQLRWFLKSLRSTGIRPRLRSYHRSKLHGSIWLGGPEYDTSSARRHLGFQSKISPQHGLYQLAESLK